MNVLRGMRALALTGTALAFLFSPAARAASINGSFPLSGQIVAQNGANLLVSTQVTMGNTITSNVGIGDFSPIGVSTSFGAVTLDLTSLPNLVAGFSLTNASFGSFAPTSALIVQQSANFLDVYFEGTFTPGAGLVAGLDPSTASVRISVNESGGSLASAISLASPPAGVPEPATVSVVAGGLAVLGLSAYRRRRAAK